MQMHRNNRLHTSLQLFPSRAFILFLSQPNAQRIDQHGRDKSNQATTYILSALVTLFGSGSLRTAMLVYRAMLWMNQLMHGR